MTLTSLKGSGPECITRYLSRPLDSGKPQRLAVVRRLAISLMLLVCSLVGTVASRAATGDPALDGPSPSTSGGQPDSKGASLTKSSCPNGTPSDTTKNQSASLESLQKFDVSEGSKSTLASAHVATAFVPAWISTDSNKNWHFYNALGVDLSTAVPVSSASLPAYAKEALLSIRGGVANLYFSAAGRDICNTVYDWEPRRTAVDHAYVMVNSPATGNELIGYVLDGIGIRAVKTALSGNGYGAVGTAYLGVGFDGPLFSFNGGPVGSRALDDTTGLMSLQVYAAENAVNPHTLEALFGTQHAPTSFASWGVDLRLGLPGRFFLSIDYSKGIGGYSSAHLSDVALVSIGYDRPSQTSDTANRQQPGAQ